MEIESTIKINAGEINSEEDNKLIESGEIHGDNDDALDELITSVNPIIFDDGSYFTVETNELLLQIIEKNVPMGNDNFEIEIYEVEDVDGNGKIQNTTNVTELKQLRMLVDRELVVNDILLDETESNNLEPSNIDNSFANYFFDVEADYEISTALICESIANADLDEYKFARKDFNCPDQDGSFGFSSPYGQKGSSNPCGDNK